MTAADIPSFDELVDLLRVRLGTADAVNVSELHSFKTLMDDHKDVIADRWYWEAFDELDALGHLDRASMKLNGFDAVARLSADGRFYLRSETDDS
jgi:hypothetical protein